MAVKYRAKGVRVRKKRSKATVVGVSRPRPATEKGPSENQIQAAYFEWASLAAGKYRELRAVYHVPNGSYKSPSMRGLFKRIGQKAGVPDVHLPVARGGKSGFWIEFKSEKGRLSDIQKEWIALLEWLGHVVVVSRDWREAADATLEYLGKPKQFAVKKSQSEDK